MLLPRKYIFTSNDCLLFSVAELQVLTVLMVRHFELHTTVSIREVQSLFSIYPAIEGKEAEGHQLPLELRAIL